MIQGCLRLWIWIEFKRIFFIRYYIGQFVNMTVSTFFNCFRMRYVWYFVKCRYFGRVRNVLKQYLLSVVKMKFYYHYCTGEKKINERSDNLSAFDRLRAYLVKQVEKYLNLFLSDFMIEGTKPDSILTRDS